MKLVLTLILSSAMALASSITFDLTAGGTAVVTAGTTGTAGSIFDATRLPTSVGSGNIDSFVRMQTNGTIEEGFDTNAVGADNDLGGNFTHIITIGDLDTTTKPGYYSFLLDINQSGSHPLLSIDSLALFYISGQPAITAQTGEPTASGIHLAYALQGATAATCFGGAVCGTNAIGNEILLDYGLNNGSGNGYDLFWFVPTSVFAGALPGDDVYLYSKFGGFGANYVNNDGYEEWARVIGPAVVDTPEPITFVLLGSGLVAFALYRRKMRA